jgi:hypothetical protein
LVALVLWAATGREGFAAAATGGGDITIVSATWGSTGHTADVKARVEELIKPPGNPVKVNPGTLKSGPGPNVLRHLIIVYTYNGMPFTVTLRGGSTLSRQLLVDNATGVAPAAV